MCPKRRLLMCQRNKNKLQPQEECLQQLLEGCPREPYGWAHAHALQIQQAASWPAQDSQAELHLVYVRRTFLARLPSPAGKNALAIKTGKLIETWQMQFPEGSAGANVDKRDVQISWSLPIPP